MSDTLLKQKKLISISEAAKILGVSLDTIRRWDKSGVLHSERPDGKNRYFSLIELEKHKSNQPLSISEAAKKLNISHTTLRRLEARGLLKPNRNNAGERVFDRELIEDFLKSDYFLRKKYTTPNKAQQLEKKDLKRGIDVYSPESTESSKEVSLYQNLKFLQRIPELLVATIIFSLLIAIGITNIQISTVKGSQSISSSLVLSATAKIEEISTASAVAVSPSPAPLVLPETEEISTSSADAVSIASASAVSTASADAVSIASASAVSIASAEVAEPKIMLIVSLDDESSSVNIRREPTTNSKKVGQAKNGDIFERVSNNSEWYEVKLTDGSTGFISAEYLKIGEIKN